MNIKVIKVGMEFKNYTNLCKTIGIEVAKGGRNLKLQKEELERFFSWQVEGRKITITEIYPEPKEKIDNRGKSEGSRNNNSVYMKHIDPILIDYFIDIDNDVTYSTINQLAEIAGITNGNYRKLKDNKNEFLNYLKENEGVKNDTALNNVFYSIQDILRPMISSSLNRLKKQGIIEYEYNYIFSKELRVKLATEEEVKIIKECEENILYELGIQKADIISNDTLRKEYYKKVNTLVYERIKDIDFYYMGYKITIKSKSKSDLKDIKEHKEELNFIVKERVENRNIRNKEKIENKNKEIVFGSQIFRDYEEDMLKENYLLDTKVIISYLLVPNTKKVKLVKTTTSKGTSKEVVEDNVQVENIIASEVNVKDNIDETKVETSSLIDEIEIYIQEDETNSETELGFDVSYRYEGYTGKLKDEYKDKPWKFEPKYPWQREDFIGSEYSNDELLAYSKETGKYIFL